MSNQPFNAKDFREMSLDNFKLMLENMNAKNFERIYPTRMTKEQLEAYRDFIAENIPASKLSPIDFEMGDSQSKDMLLYGITGSQVLYLLDALEFYAKHHKKMTPPRIAKMMKYDSDILHCEIVESWRKGVAPVVHDNLLDLFE
jgi:hypothetical protein